MTNHNIKSEVLYRVEKLLDVLYKKRLRDVIERRFGLKNGNKETLEAIGQNYNITRERVRQIEVDALNILNEKENLEILKPIFEYLDKLFEEHYRLIGEEKLLSTLTRENYPHSSRSAILLVLFLGESYERFPESEKFHSHWTNKKDAGQAVEKIVNYLTQYLAEKNQPHLHSDLLGLILKKYKSIGENLVLNALDISKEIDKNVFDELGLSYWPDINPKGVRDKAYLALKKQGEPEHFTEITNLINQAGFTDRKAFSQTVHNELIKDKRFVLVGRGIYALAEWGYRPGIVKEIIAEVLTSSKKPLTKDEVIMAVLNQRKVKPNTITINLQNHPEFKKLEDGKYSLT